jgi:hypothetical protein
MAFDLGSVIAHIKADTSNFEKGISSVKKQTQGVGKAFASASKTASVFAGVGLAGLTLFTNKSIQASNEQIKVEAKLDNLMSNRTGTTKEQIQAVKDLASEVQSYGIIGDESIINGQAQLATFLLSSDAIKELTPAMADMVAQQKGFNATGEDFVNVGNLMGKVMEGQVGALGRYGVSFSDAQEEVLKNGNEMERASALAEVLAQNYGGVNKALRETPEGRAKAAMNNIGDAMEMFGKAVTSVKDSILVGLLPALDALMFATKALFTGDLDGALMRSLGIYEDDEIVTKLMNIRRALFGLIELFQTDDIGNFGEAMRGLGFSEEQISFVGVMVGKLRDFGYWVTANKEQILTFLKGMAIAFGALAIIGTITFLITALLNPLTLITLAVGALYLAWQNNFLGIQDITKSIFDWITKRVDQFKAFWEQYGEDITTIAQGAWNIILGIIQYVWNTIVGIFKVFSAILSGDWDALWGALQQLSKNQGEALTRIFSGILDVISGLFGMWVTTVSNYLRDLFNKAKEWAGKIKDQLNKINPFHKSSPSLVENVIKGVGIIKGQYKNLGGAVNSSISSLPGAGAGVVPSTATSAGNLSLNISMDGAFIGDELSAMRMGEKIGDQIIRKLQGNVRF